ncbi:DUF421 domain-containing protein [Paenibacillus solisilvae]|uniref:DUF421 domain-containing protein n=1 Tax=Paenibacillus solisilvae TaxID=2486751 RepID=A0ABW0VZN4_9BACL
MPDWFEIALRTLFAVVFLFLLTKLLGKRQVTQLSLFEYITGITIGNLAAFLSTDLDSHWSLGMIALGVWALFSLGIEFVQLKSKRARDFLDGKATVLIKDGQIQEANLKKERMTSDDLLEQLRKKDVFRMADVEFALMETSGDLNILLKKENQPLTASDLGITVGVEQVSQAVIMDGKIMDEPLAAIKQDRTWLEGELKKLNLTADQVYLGQVDTYGQLSVDLYNDQITLPESQQKAQLLAILKKCEANLEMFGLSTEHKKAKAMYQRCAKKLDKVITDVKPHLIQ